MEDYYLDEITAIMSEWNSMHSPDSDDEKPVQVDAMAFFGEGGEVIGS